MKPKPDTPEWSAYSAGQRAFHAGLLRTENPISNRHAESRPQKQSMRDWWDAGWWEAERQTRQDQAGPW